MKKILVILMAFMSIMATNVLAALPAGVVTEFSTLSVSDLDALLIAVVAFGIGLFAFRKARSILKA